jgi:hypothetical protein
MQYFLALTMVSAVIRRVGSVLLEWGDFCQRILSKPFSVLTPIEGAGRPSFSCRVDK